MFAETIEMATTKLMRSLIPDELMSATSSRLFGSDMPAKLPVDNQFQPMYR
ncbi:MAG: hypothetical protein KKE76_11240 [Gammaproteobacteria bacterium]|nr:hypothetical protein [Gammaproteobacteria bacterium]